MVVNEQNVVLGRLRPEALAGAAGEETAEAVMEAGPTAYRPNMRLEEAAKRMQAKDVASLLVTTSNGQLIGLLYRRDAEERLAGKQQGGTDGGDND